MNPKVGDLWRSTGRIMVGAGRWIHPGSLLLIVERDMVDTDTGDGESRVVWEGGSGWISDLCILWEPVNEAG
jgi:hypothetical protein